MSVEKEFSAGNEIKETTDDGENEDFGLVGESSDPYVETQWEIDFAQAPVPNPEKLFETLKIPAQGLFDFIYSNHYDAVDLDELEDQTKAEQQKKIRQRIDEGGSEYLSQEDKDFLEARMFFSSSARGNEAREKIAFLQHEEEALKKEDILLGEVAERLVQPQWKVNIKSYNERKRRYDERRKLLEEETEKYADVFRMKKVWDGFLKEYPSAAALDKKKTHVWKKIELLGRWHIDPVIGDIYAHYEKSKYRKNILQGAMGNVINISSQIDKESGAATDEDPESLTCRAERFLFPYLVNKDDTNLVTRRDVAHCEDFAEAALKKMYVALTGKILPPIFFKEFLTQPDGSPVFSTQGSVVLIDVGQVEETKRILEDALNMREVYEEKDRARVVSQLARALHYLSTNNDATPTRRAAYLAMARDSLRLAEASRNTDGAAHYRGVAQSLLSLIEGGNLMRPSSRAP